MRSLTNKDKVTDFMIAVGRLVRTPVSVFFTGGSTAVLEGWRDTTLDIDIKFSPELDELFRGISVLKEKLGINIELASPPDFIPELPGWRERCIYIGREGSVDFYNYDPYSQALAKIERGHQKDTEDVEAMFANGLITSHRLLSLFSEIKPHLYKYPAIDPPSFERSVGIVAQRHA